MRNEILLVAKVLNCGSAILRKMEQKYLLIPCVRDGVRTDASKRLIGPAVEVISTKPASVKTARHSRSLRKLESIPICASTSRASIGRGFNTVSLLLIEVENHVLATSQISQTTLRSVLGQRDLDDLLTNRETINEVLQKIIDEQTEPWGIKVSVVEVKDVEIPQNMQRAMARQAESERERRAKIIAAEGEYQASERLRQAADRLESPTALQLRLFQTMGEIATEQNSTIILPVPLDLFKPFLESQNGSYGQGVRTARREEEKEAEQLYEEAVGDARREVSSEEVPSEMPDGEANR